MQSIFDPDSHAMTSVPIEISFQVRYEDIATRVRTRTGAYRNLMELLRDSMYLDEFGECGGTGRCATCAVEIEWADGVPRARERNEESTLSDSPPNLRLACQVDVDERLQNARVIIRQEGVL